MFCIYTKSWYPARPACLLGFRAGFLPLLDRLAYAAAPKYSTSERGASKTGVGLSWRLRRSVHMHGELSLSKEGGCASVACMLAAERGGIRNEKHTRLAGGIPSRYPPACDHSFNNPGPVCKCRLLKIKRICRQNLKEDSHRCHRCGTYSRWLETMVGLRLTGERVSSD